ncbi:MAG TPA: HAMP domain-containing sensor histidine kinase [Gemmatimonadaceae bacterium]|jgi:two-component system nitrogen regulation sensor histidine kinase NtrY|nr:HAMP domain-containing sensor histidine kinase [Gemmatimonadaceae bacterium]
MKQLRFRTRLIVILSLFAIVPAALLTLFWAGTMSSALSLVGGRAAWENVATSGKTAIAAVRAAPLTASQRQLLDQHERELSASLEQAHRFSFLAGRSGRIVAVLGFLALIFFGVAASRVAGHLSRQLSRPIDELVSWTALVGHGKPLPPPTQQPARGAPEFATLRRSMRAMSAELDESRQREAENERLRAYRESARRVAHELKNPLTPIRFAVDTLRRRVPEELRDTVDVLATESQRIERIAKSFSEFGRLPEGPVSEIDVADLLASSTRSLPPDIELVSQIDDDLPRINGHHDALSGAITNVVLNAVDACHGKGTITVEAHKIRNGVGDAIEISVSDNGAGIEPDKLTHIWEPYVTQKPGGTGLGLAIARQAVLAHDGTVQATSTFGEGTRIRFVLPVKPGQTDKELS